MRDQSTDRLAYLAGFFDGEGNVRVAKNSKNEKGYYLRISATQVDPAPLRLFQDEFGGYVYFRPRPSSRDGHIRQAISEWVLAGPRAAAALRALLPHLVVKRGAAQLAIDFQGYVDLRPTPNVRLTGYELAERQSYSDALRVRVRR